MSQRFKNCRWDCIQTKRASPLSAQATWQHSLCCPVKLKKIKPRNETDFCSAHTSLSVCRMPKLELVASGDLTTSLERVHLSEGGTSVVPSHQDVITGTESHCHQRVGRPVAGHGALQQPLTCVQVCWAKHMSVAPNTEGRFGDTF